MRAPPPSAAPPTAQPELDPLAAQRWRALARAQSPWLHEEVGQRMAQRPASLRGRGHRQRLLAAIEHELPRTPEGQWSLSFEVIYGHAVRATPRVPVAASSSVPLEQMRQWLRQGRG